MYTWPGVVAAALLWASLLGKPSSKVLHFSMCALRNATQHYSNGQTQFVLREPGGRGRYYEKRSIEGVLGRIISNKIGKKQH